MHRLRALLLVAIHAAFVVSTLTTDPSNDPYSCSASKPCKIGCCGNNNVCGLGPDYCASDKCQSSCDAKSDCDPGWGSQWSTTEDCPLSVCCSKYGFCGTTEDFCGTKTVQAPSCSGGSTASQKIIGYYEGWSTTRACQGLFPEDILASQYTHLNYAFAFIDPSSFAVAPMSSGDVDLYPRFTGLKSTYPGLQTWISIGGWSMNDPDQATHDTFSTLAGSKDAQTKFFSSLVNFMTTYGFDGVDIDWEYPVAPERSGKPEDFANYVSFLTNLKAALGTGGKQYGLTITLPSSYWYMQNFDIVRLETIVDWFNVMTYDLHGTWDSTDPYVGAKIEAHTNLTEISQTMDLLWRNHIDPAKVVMGTGFYGRSFTLSDPSCNQAGCPFSAGGNPGPCTASAGTLSYAEITDIVNAGAQVTEDKAAGVAIVTWDNDQWVSYDNNNTLKLKMDFANNLCLGGVMVWASSTDTVNGDAIVALTGAAGRSDLSEKSLLGWRPKDPIGQCVWGECSSNGEQAACPSGLVPATGTGGKVSGLAGIFNGCDKGQSRYYCCPSGSDASCQWRGTAPLCGAAGGATCKSGEVEVTTDSYGTGAHCWTGHKTLCCESKGNTALSDAGQCEWLGAAPFCTTLGGLLDSPASYFTSYPCPKDHPDQLTTSKQGAGGEKPCWYDAGFKSYCCKDPVPYQNCAWHQASASWTNWAASPFFIGPLGGLLGPLANTLGQDCKGECPVGQVPIATDGFNCQPGTYSYFCCDNPNAPSIPSPAEAICPQPATIDGLNSQPDPESQKGLDGLIESDFGEDDCSLSFLGSASSKRDLLGWQDDGADSIWDNSTLGDISELHLLDKRTPDNSAILKYCIKGEPSGTIRPSTYSGFRTIAGLPGKGWIYIGKPLLCGAIGVVVNNNPSSSVLKWVTEHVFEKQSLRNFIQLMSKGLRPDGKALAAGAPTVKGIFDEATGILFKAWPANLKPSFGATPIETLFGYLGHTKDGSGPAADVTNLQVVDAFLNAIKSKVTQYADFLGADYASKAPKQQVQFLADVIDSFSYVKVQQVVGSYNGAYKNLIATWDLVKQIPGAQSNYDYSGAFKEIVSADLDKQISEALAVFKPAAQSALTFWQSSAAKARFTPGEIKENVDALTDFVKNVATYISFDKANMIK